MTDERLAEIRARLDAATPGPWRHDGVDVFTITDGGQGYPLDRYPDSVEVCIGQCPDCGDGNVGFSTDDDREFVCAARTALPELLDAIRDIAIDLKCEQIRSEDRGRSFQAVAAQLAAMTAARDEACDLAVHLNVNRPVYSQVYAEDIDRLRAVGKEST